MRTLTLSILFLSLLACSSAEPSLLGKWSHTESDHTLTFKEGWVTIGNDKASVEETYQVKGDKLIFFERPNLMRGLEMTFKIKGNKLVLDEGLDTERVYRKLEQ